MPVGVRDARTILESQGFTGEVRHSGEQFGPGPAEPGPDTRGDALSVRRLWVELDPGEGPVDVLRGIDLSRDPGGGEGRPDGPERGRESRPSCGPPPD